MTNQKFHRDYREQATLQELLQSFNVFKRDAMKPRYEVLCRYATAQDRAGFKDCIYNLSGDDMMIVRVRAVQAYSAEITSALLDESRKGVNARYEDETQKRIPVYLLGPNEGQEDSVSAKIELGMPGGVPKNFPDVIAHDTENMYRESIMKHGLKPGGHSRSSRVENHFYVLPDRLFEGRRGGTTTRRTVLRENERDAIA